MSPFLLLTLGFWRKLGRAEVLLRKAKPVNEVAVVDEADSEAPIPCLPDQRRDSPTANQISAVTGTTRTRPTWLLLAARVVGLRFPTYLIQRRGCLWIGRAKERSWRMPRVL